VRRDGRGGSAAGRGQRGARRAGPAGGHAPRHAAHAAARLGGPPGRPARRRADRRQALTVPGPLSTLVVNCGAIVTGDLAAPHADGDAIAIREGRIEAIGRASAFDRASFDLVVDARGTTATPGLIDPHVHPMLGDWHPRQAVFGWMESALQGGVTSMLSQGTNLLPGRPRDAFSTKALAVLVSQSYRNHRPGGGLKLLSGAVILEAGLRRADFAEMAAAGVRLVAEIGASGIYGQDRIGEMLEWARAAGMVIPIHFGAASIPGSLRIGAADVALYRPDVVVHVNGGPISAPVDEIDEVVDRTATTVEVIQCGNTRTGVHAARRLRDRGALARLIIGSDTPVGHGAIPLAILKTVVQLASLADLPAGVAIAAATGNTARAYRLDDVGLLAPGRAGDVLLMDRASGADAASALETIERGDLPAITTVLVEGRPVSLRGRNSPFTDRVPAYSGRAAAALRHPAGFEESLLPPLFA
jgi:enamidase